ncbi:MAG: hypothetical protein KJ070_15995 [Verrucomicrobia bacterium]|nr:hypothetical protein [Verrucomicrobiota bacterium]
MFDTATLKALERELDTTTHARIEQAVERIVAAKNRGGKVVVVTGSGPNLHEGVTTLLAELMRVGLVDGVTTSSAVIAHEMGGTLDRVKRCPGASVGVPTELLPLGGEFELTLMNEDSLREIRETLSLDQKLIERLQAAPGKTIIKAAGNLGYPMGLWLEKLAPEILTLARSHGISFEEMAGLGSDPRTMIGVAAQKGLPVLVTIPQLIGGGRVGLCIGDSLTLTERATRLARMLSAAEVIIESGVALTQEIHDGPFETHTGHGLWSAWQGDFSYSLAGKSLIRIDLDPALERVCQIEREGGAVQSAIADGLPKTKTFKVPFRMEMSGFARHAGSLAIIGDLGMVWPLMATRAAQRLGVEPRFLCYPQQTEAGRKMRETIVEEVQPFSRRQMLEAVREKHPRRSPT